MPADAELAAASIGQESIGDQLIDGLVDQLGAVETAPPIIGFNSETPSRCAIAARGMRAVTRSTRRSCSAAVGRHGFGFAIV
jgi:hypothetical protein